MILSVNPLKVFISVRSGYTPNNTPPISIDWSFPPAQFQHLILFLRRNNSALNLIPTIMKATTFKLQEVTNPNTGTISQRIAVAFDNGDVIKLFTRNATVEDTVVKIKADRDAAIKSVVVINDGQFGKYCILSNAVDKEEF